MTNMIRFATLAGCVVSSCRGVLVSCLDGLATMRRTSEVPVHCYPAR